MTNNKKNNQSMEQTENKMYEENEEAFTIPNEACCSAEFADGCIFSE